MSYFIGVDIGTTAVKVVAFDKNGNILSTNSGPYEMNHPQEGWSEQDPDEIFFAVIRNLNSLYASLLPEIPAAISFSAAMHSLIAMDDQGMPMTACIIWADSRAAAEAEILRSSPAGKLFYSLTGVPIHAMSPLCKLVWFKKHQPEIIEKAFKWIGIKEYVLFRLTNQYVSDTSIAASTGLMNLNTLKWEKLVLDFLQIDIEKLPTLVDVKHQLHFRDDLQDDLIHIPVGTPLVLGGSDGACANLATGIYDESSLVVTIGTSSAVRMLSRDPYIDEKMRTFSYHARDEFYINGGGGNSGAVVLSWLKNDLLESGEDMGRFLDQAEFIAPGSEGLIFLPYILGERAPLWNPYTRGVFFGLSVTHTRAHMVRAALEGVIFGVYSIGKVLLEKKKVSNIHATGGFAKNIPWVQMLADVFNLPVVLNSSEESSAWGAVTTALLSVGLALPEISENQTVINPDANKHEIYSRSFQKFEELNESLSKFFVVSSEK